MIKLSRTPEQRWRYHWHWNELLLPPSVWPRCSGSCRGITTSWAEKGKAVWCQRSRDILSLISVFLALVCSRGELCPSLPKAKTAPRSHLQPFLAFWAKGTRGSITSEPWLPWRWFCTVFSEVWWIGTWDPLIFHFLFNSLVLCYILWHLYSFLHCSLNVLCYMNLVYSSKLFSGRTRLPVR